MRRSAEAFLPAVAKRWWSFAIAGAIGLLGDFFGLVPGEPGVPTGMVVGVVVLGIPVASFLAYADIRRRYDELNDANAAVVIDALSRFTQAALRVVNAVDAEDEDAASERYAAYEVCSDALNAAAAVAGTNYKALIGPYVTFILFQLARVSGGVTIHATDEERRKLELGHYELIGRIGSKEDQLITDIRSLASQ